MTDVKDLIYTETDIYHFKTDTKLKITELKDLIYVNFREEDDAILKVREELAETKNQVSALERMVLEQDDKIFAKAMEKEQTVTDMRMELREMGDRVTALEDGAVERDGGFQREDEESEMRGEIARLREMILGSGDEVTRLEI